MMKKIIYFLGISVVFFSCEKHSKNETVEVFGIEIQSKDSLSDDKGDFKMYEMSEMAVLMEQMYVDNERLKARILKKDTLGKFPMHFLAIEQAKFTKGKKGDAFFTEQADKFIAKQMEIYTSKDTIKAFNAMVDQCIACHEVKCGGPIARIKKLYIK